MRILGRTLPLRPAHVQLWGKKGKVLATEMGGDIKVEISVTSEEGAIFLLEIYLSVADCSLFLKRGK